MTEVQKIIAKNMSEAELQTNIIDLAKNLGWLVHAERPAVNRRGQWSTPIQGDEGFPDLVLAKDERLLAVEVKSEKGELSDSQINWHKYLATAVWRPTDWLSGEIERILKGGIEIKEIITGSGA